MIDACITTTGKHGMEKCEISKGCIIPQENKETSQKLLKSDDYGNDLIRSILEMGNDAYHSLSIYLLLVRARSNIGSTVSLQNTIAMKKYTAVI